MVDVVASSSQESGGAVDLEGFVEDIERFLRVGLRPAFMSAMAYNSPGFVICGCRYLLLSWILWSP